MTAREAASVLYEVQTYLELNGEDEFRSRAYARAARALETADIGDLDLDALARIPSLPGIGKTMAAEIRQIVETGTSTVLEEMRARTPIGLIDCTALRGLGGKKVRALHTGLGIRSLDELESACRDSRVAGLAGFGVKSQEKILTAIAELKKNRGRFRIDVATRLVDTIVPQLTALRCVSAASAAGQARRGGEEFDDVSFVVAADDAGAVAEAVAADGVLTEVTLEDGTISGTAADRFAVRVHVARPESFPIALVRHTGSPEHLEALAGALEERGVSMNGESVELRGERIPVASEEALYALAGLQFIEPELREGLDEIELAREQDLPDLVSADDMRGMLHVHSRWSDGRSSIPELVTRCRELGYRYLLMCDHSKAAFYANGLDEKRLEEQGREIDEINSRLDPSEFRVLKGIECDILADGALDLEPDALAALDAVVISIHSRFDMPREAQTERLCRALENPHSTILGHSTGRLLLSRRGYDVDLPTVIDAAAAHGKCIELNCNPYRLDLEWRLIRNARRKGVPIAINPDAHTLLDLENMRHGITIARKGMLTRDEVLNSKTADEFLAWARATSTH